MKVLFLLFSALSVSADSFFMGLSLSTLSRDYKSILLGVSSAVLCLSLIGATVGYIIPNHLINVATLLAGTCLFLMGFFEFNKTQSVLPLMIKTENTFNLSILSGASIGVDGAVGSLALTLGGYYPLFVAIYITAMHLLLLSCSFVLSKKILGFKALEKLPCALVMALGIFKIIDGIL